MELSIDDDVKTLLNKNRIENENMMASHTAQLMAKIEKMENVLSQFAVSVTSEETSDRISPHITSKMILGDYLKTRKIITPGYLDEKTRQLRGLANTEETAPKYHILDDDGDRKMTVRATIEGKDISLENIAVKTTESRSAPFQNRDEDDLKLPIPSQICRREENKSKSCMVSKRVKNSRFVNSVYNKSVCPSNNFKKKNKNVILDDEDVDAGELAMVDYYGEKVNINDIRNNQLQYEQNKLKDSKDHDKPKASYNELGQITGYLMRKSQMLIDDANKFTKHRRKKKRTKKTINYTLPKIDIDPTTIVRKNERSYDHEYQIENIGNDNDEYDDDEDVMTRNKMDRLPSVNDSNDNYDQNIPSYEIHEVPQLRVGSEDTRTKSDKSLSRQDYEKFAATTLHSDLEGRRVIH
jgi:hypothetical protein